ncbi:MAG TPA: response regulator transcription factor [Actinomycetota bacterium]|nr:response regulator transcription factor [Actinomycetota bacterium]
MTTGPRLLVVDDDERIIEIMRVALEEEGYRVDTAGDAEQALQSMRVNRPDLLVLDVMLPGRDGFELCREIRKSSSVPIVLLTAKTDTIDVVVGLESGADDYVTKPFEMRVLVARLRSLLRRARSREGAERILHLGPLEIRPDEGVVLKNGASLPLTRTEFRLLCTLASRPSRVFSRELLLEEVWGYDYFGDARLVDVHIRRLRSKVEDDPAHPVLVQTVRGMGYKLSEAQSRGAEGPP